MSRSPQIFEEMKGAVEELGPALKKKFTGIVKFNINNVGTWTLDLKSDNPTVIKDASNLKPDLTIILADDVFAALYDGKQNAQNAFMKGKLKIKGSTSLAMKFNTVLTMTRKQLEKSKAGGAKKPGPSANAAAASSAPSAAADGSSNAPKARVIFDQIAEVLPIKGPELVAKMKGVVQFDINGEKWLLNLKTGNGSLSKGTGPSDLTVTMSDDTFFDVSQGKVSAQQAFMKGNIKIKGNMGMATKLGPVLQAAKPKARL